jgi:hypothetical protein
MIPSDDKSGAEPLSVSERARLRPSVDVAALQRWLDATHDEVRVAVIAHFASSVNADDLRAIGQVVGATAEDLAAWDAMADESLPLGPLQIPGPDAPPNALAFRSIPTSQAFVMMEPPKDPILASLWNAIEPTR